MKPDLERYLEVLNSGNWDCDADDYQSVLMHAIDLRAALKEASCWIPDGSRRTPEERGAKAATAYDVEKIIADTLGEP